MDRVKIKIKNNKALSIVVIVVLLIALVTLSVFSYQTYSENKRLTTIQQEKEKIEQELTNIETELEELKSEDQYQRNEKLQEEIKNIQNTYSKAVSVYEDVLDFRASSKEATDLETKLAESLNDLSNRDYESAETGLSEITSTIASEKAKVVVAVATEPEPAPVNNAPPGSGYSRQQVQTDASTFTVSLIAADIGSTRIIVDTASGGDCGNDCSVLPLADYVSRNGAYAGVNGSYFCPATYPSCAGKTNTFDTLLMNKDKTYFNSDNNVYSNNPAVIFGGGYIRFVGAASQWGRDTGIDSMISNYPLLVSGGNVVFGGDDDPKKGSKGNRSFVADKGNQVYIGVVHSATVAESARVMNALGMNNALNLDNGGSTALWSGGYKVGPGRNLPNVILFVGR